MDINDDEEDETLLKLNENELRELYEGKLYWGHADITQAGFQIWHTALPNGVYVISNLVRPTLAHDSKRLEAEFIHGYWSGTLVFYVSITNKYGDEMFVKDVDTSNWGPHWTSVNIEFEAKLALNPHLRFLWDRMFFICNGNHCFKAWTCYIDRLHQDDWKWHYIVDSICLDTRGKDSVLMNAMYNINKWDLLLLFLMF